MPSVNRPLPTRGRTHAPTRTGSSPEPPIALAGNASLHTARLRQAYTTHRSLVYGIALSIVRNPHDAEDVAHDVFVKLLTRLDRCQPTQATFPAWLACVARNEALDHLRRTTRRRYEPIDDAVVPDREHSYDAAIVTDAIARLPRDQREVLVLRHVAGLKPGEIAGYLVRTPASVNGLLHRGTGALRRELTAASCEPCVAA
jgi:RNA polymerase sigma-70 factor (ECF subfamily)